MGNKIDKALKGKKYVVFFEDIYDEEELVWKAEKRYEILDFNKAGTILIKNETQELKCGIEYNYKGMYLI